MGAINWNNVTYIESDKKLIFTEQSVSELPDAIINLYHNRVFTLDMSFNSLTSLNGLEFFVTLKELILDNNLLSDNVKLPKVKSLTTLSLNNNKINNLNIFLLRLSNCFPNLEYLSMMGNKACPDCLTSTKTECTYEQYRAYVISMLPKLKFLDSREVSPIERENSIDLARLDDTLFSYPLEVFRRFRQKENQPNIAYNPLPSPQREAGQHKGKIDQSVR